MKTPALDHLAAAYFHQDWVSEFGDEKQAVDAFVAGSPGLATNLGAEVEWLLSTRTEEEIDAHLEAVGCELTKESTTGGYRAWLADVALHVSLATGRRASR